MANITILELTQESAPAGNDALEIQKAGGGAGSSKYALIADVLKATGLTVITSNTTYTVKTSGGDYTTLPDALTALQNVLISPGVVVTIEVDDGTWTHTASLVDAQLSSRQIRIVGKNTYSKTVTSIQSSSGTTGAFSVIINVDSTANVAVNDYIIIMNATGGTNPLRLCGCHVVTAIDTPNNRLTVTSVNRIGAPSGAVTATATVVKTILSFTGVSGLAAANRGWYSVDKLVLAGSGTAGMTGISALEGAQVRSLNMTGSILGIVGFDTGILANQGSQAFLQYSAISGCPQGVQCSSNAVINVTGAVITGASGLGGIYTLRAGVILVSSGVVTGNAIGIWAGNNSYVTAVATTITDNTTNSSPALNTLGNENGYIDA